MRYAVIADIHGNLPCLEACLADAQAHQADAFLFLGDYCIGSPWGNDVVNLIRGLPEARVISGNEELLFRQDPAVFSGDNGQYEVTRWTFSQMNEENLSYLAALPEDLTWQDGPFTLHMTHRPQDAVPNGALRSFRSTRMAQRFPSGTTRAAFLSFIEAELAANDALHEIAPRLPMISLFGHNHAQWHAQVDGKWLINPGSCGEALDCCGFAACYALLTIEEGRVTVEERRLPMDVEDLIAQVKATGQYEHAQVWSELVFRSWRTSRESVFPFFAYAESYAERIGDPVRPFTKTTWHHAFAAWQNERFP